MSLEPGIDLRYVGLVLWRELPLVLTLGLLATLAGGLTAIVAVAFSPLAPLAAAVTIGPIWMAMVAVAADLLDGRAVNVRQLAATLRRWAPTGIATAMVPAAVATLLLGSLGVLSAHPEQRWLLAPVALDATVLAVLALGAFGVFPLALVDRRSTRRRWITALGLAGRDLVTTLGLAALVVLLALSTQLVGPLVVALMAGPLAVLSTATTRHAVTHVAARGSF